MKRLICILFLIISVDILFAQDIILTFNPVGAATTIDNIEATNVNTGGSITITGNQSLNINTIPNPDPTGIESIINNSENTFVYPNPFNNKTELQFFTNKTENITVYLINAFGAMVAKTVQNISPGLHKFEISGNSAGMYIINLITKEKMYSEKVICLNENGNENRIEYVGQSGENVSKEKSQLIESGDLIHIVLTSGKYKTVISDKPTESKTYDVEFMECIDKDGKAYKVVQIGNQWWMAENLAYLPSVSPSNEGSNNYSYYYVNEYGGKNVSEAKATDIYKVFGVLYNWRAAMINCPVGWHLPTDNEWKQLETYIGMSESEVNRMDWRGTNEGNKLKTATGWNETDSGDNGNGTDDYGFSGLPGGYKNHIGGLHHLGMFGYWWSSTTDSSTSAWHRYVGYDRTKSHRYPYPFNMGISVRCLRN